MKSWVIERYRLFLKCSKTVQNSFLSNVIATSVLSMHIPLAWIPFITCLCIGLYGQSPRGSSDADTIDLAKHERFFDIAALAVTVIYAVCGLSIVVSGGNSLNWRLFPDLSLSDVALIFAGLSSALVGFQIRDAQTFAG